MRPTEHNTPSHTCPTCGAHSKGGGVCHTCHKDTTRRLRALPGWWRELQTTITRQDRLTVGGGHSTEQWIWPYNERASHTADWVARQLAGYSSKRHVPSMIADLTNHHHTLALHDTYPGFVTTISRVTTRIMWVVDRPDIKTKIEVGPCYHQLDDGEPCTGTVWAYFPSDDGAWAPIMGCDQVEDHWWPTLTWARAGILIARRKIELDQQAVLARTIGRITT